MSEPYYYVEGGFSPIEAFKKGLLTQEQYIGFVKGNIIKYVVRCGYKEDDIGDLEKAEVYLGFLKEIYSKPKRVGKVDDGGSFNNIMDILEDLEKDGWEKDLELSNDSVSFRRDENPHILDDVIRKIKQ